MAFERRTRKPPTPLDQLKLYDYAVKALGRSMRTVAQLKRLMRGKVEAGETGEQKIAAVVARLHEHRYLDDAAFAAAYTRLRQENDSFGRRRVELELGRRGIARDLIARTVETAYQENNEEELARRYLARKRIQKPQDQKETARVMRRLVAAGFSVAIISRILRNWEIDFSEDDLPPSPGSLDGEPGSES